MTTTRSRVPAPSLLLLPFLAAMALRFFPPGPPPTRPGLADARPGPRRPREARGLDRAALESLDRDFASGQHGYVDSMLVVRGGSVVFERSYRHDYDRLFVGQGHARALQLLRPAVAPLLEAR